MPWQESITKNGYIETHEVMMETAATDAAVSEAEAEFERNGQLHDAREALASLRRKHFGSVQRQTIRYSSSDF